jgi:alpha-glucosidase (family GH31 glycosyl hydrolase)
MKTKFLLCLLGLLSIGNQVVAQRSRGTGSEQGTIVLHSNHFRSGQSLRIEGLFFETASGRELLPPIRNGLSDSKGWTEANNIKGRQITISLEPQGSNFQLSLKAQPDSDIIKWGLTIESAPNEYYTGLMERVVDGPQVRSWETGIQEAMNLRGQKVDMIVKPTTSVYAPFYLSSKNYAVLVQGDWPGHFDFAASDPKRVKIEFEGPSFGMKIYTASDPAGLVKTHALDAGPPFMPPKWLFTPWRWRDEHTQRTTYYDGTRVSGPFNSEIMEDVLMMKAFGIPNGIYWIDRPWGPWQTLGLRRF